jgi:hypothetical protein
MSNEDAIIKTEYSVEAKLIGASDNLIKYRLSDMYYQLHDRYTKELLFDTPQKAAGVARGWKETGFNGCNVSEWRVVRHDWIIRDTIEMESKEKENK